MGVAVPFPEVQPPGYAWFDDEPAFEPDRHLALARPKESLSLHDLGYESAEIATKATTFGVSSPFRILSDEGASVMLEVARRLRQFTKPAGDRIERSVRGGCYRSRWLRDLCTCPELTDHLSEIYGTEVAPHAMPLHLGHLNYEPSVIDAAVDKWHHDTIALDFVLAVTDPASVAGGRFEYVMATKHEMAAWAERGELPPPERVVAPELPGPGYAIALHGDMVVHRGAPLTAKAERITMVNGYMSMDPWCDEQSRHRDLIVVDDPRLLYTEWARFSAWRSRGRLERLLADPSFEPDGQVVAAELEAAISDVQRAVTDMRSGARATEHYGG